MKTKLALAALVLLVGITSCKKNGKGGEASIVTTTYHNNNRVAYAVTYVKYNATSFPGTDLSKYELAQKADNLGKCTFSNMRYGNYYLYSVGYDSTNATQISGGVAVEISWLSRKKEKNLTLTVE